MVQSRVRLLYIAPFYPIRGRDSLDLVEMHTLKLGSYAPQAVSSFQTARYGVGSAMVEHRIVVPSVAGSSPVLHPIK